jgi:outer membrane scaffolding protein for murein synthesis (MipA/OmpV family)
MRINLYLSQFLALMLFTLSASQVFAQQEIALEGEEQPVWEAGVFAAGFRSPVYPAADQSQTNVIPAPYFIYRGETLRIGDGAIARAVAVDKSWYELDLSLGGSFNANSDDNMARTDMPDLDFIFEVGPQLRLLVADVQLAEKGQGELHLNLKGRAAFSTDFSGVNQRGYVFQSEFEYIHKGWLSEKTAISIGITPTWATERLHDYFYQVGSEFVSPQRQAFDAQGGYLGTDISVGLSFNPTPDIRVFLRGRASIHSGAANEDSPLFKNKSTFSVGAGLVWRLYQSDEKVSGR